MAEPTDVLSVVHWEDADLVLMARVRNYANANVLQASVTSVVVHVYDRTTGDQVGATLTPAVADVVFDTLQTGGTWTADRTGYNFRCTVPGSRFPEGGRTYDVEVVFTPTTGSPFPFVAMVDVKALRSS